MTKTNSFTKIVLVVMSIMMLMSVMVVFSSATNIDSDFAFSFNGYMDDTGLRKKDNDSCLYMYCQTANTPYMASARGAYNEYSTDYYDCSFDWDDDTPQVFTYTFTSGVKRFMYNYVIENGFDYAAISASTSSNGYASGLWSPDSVSESGVLPPSDYNRN